MTSQDRLFDVEQTGPLPTPMAGPGAHGVRCGTCAHLICHQWGRNRYHRCELVEQGRLRCKAVIKGDYCARRRLSSPACNHYEAKGP